VGIEVLVPWAKRTCCASKWTWLFWMLARARPPALRANCSQSLARRFWRATHLFTCEAPCGMPRRPPKS